MQYNVLPCSGVNTDGTAVVAVVTFEGVAMGSTRAREWGILVFLMAVLTMLVLLSLTIGSTGA